MNKIISLFIAVAFICVSIPTANAQHVASGTQNYTTRVTIVADNIVRVVKYMGEKEPMQNSLSVVLKMPATNSSATFVSSKRDSFKYKNISIRWDGGALSIFKNNAKVLQEKKESGHFFPVDDDGKLSYNIRQAFSINSNEAIYGLGQHQTGVMNQRNQHIYLQQKNMDIGIPFFQSTGHYGILWDNNSATNYDDSLNTIMMSSAYGQKIDYYVVLGNTADDIMHQYRLLTGEAPMLPIWSFGFIQSKERYKKPEELLAVVRAYRQRGIPLDAVVQDWQYWGADNDNWNAVAYTNPEYHSVASYIDSIHAEHAKVMISVWPSFGSNSEIYKELDGKNMLYNFYTFPVKKNVRVYDAFNPEARDIYWKYMYQNLWKSGIDGWWLDAVEPVQKNIVSGDPDKAGQELYYKDKTENAKGVATYIGSFQANANAYPLATVQGVYEHQRSVESDKRAIILTRSGTAGQQRNAAVLWSGDIIGSWNVLRAQIPAAINMSYSGIPYWNSDIGGFYSNKLYPKALHDSRYRELYLRWFQFATFTAMMRAHGTNIPREIYRFGKPGDLAYDVMARYIRLRYQLMPYIYSNAWDVTKNAGSMMRGLAMDFPKDSNVLNIATEFMFGRNILVAPILDSTIASVGDSLSYEKRQIRNTYLPSTCDWYDYSSGKKYRGGSTVQQSVNIAEMPVFVRAGSIIPEASVLQYVDLKKYDTLTIKIYSGTNAKFTLYEDEGDNYNYEQKKYSNITFEWNESPKKLIIHQRVGSFSGMLKNRYFKVIYYNGTHDKEIMKSVKYSGKQTEVLF